MQRRGKDVEKDMRSVRFVAKKSKELHIKAPNMMDVWQRTGNHIIIQTMKCTLRNIGFRATLFKAGITKSFLKIIEIH